MNRNAKDYILYKKNNKERIISCEKQQQKVQGMKAAR